MSSLVFLELGNSKFLTDLLRDQLSNKVMELCFLAWSKPMQNSNSEVDKNYFGYMVSPLSCLIRQYEVGFMDIVAAESNRYDRIAQL